MRMLMKVRMPVVEANASLESGRLPELMQRLFETIRPEASYFVAEGGTRCAFIVFDLQRPEDIPVVCEPLFRELHAEIEATPAMSFEEVQRGLQREREATEREGAPVSH